MKRFMLFFSIIGFLMLLGTPTPIEAISAALTDLVADIVPIAVTVLTAVLGVAGGVILVKAGLRWLRGMMG